MATSRIQHVRAPLALALVVLAVSTVALSDNLFVTEAMSKGEVLNAAGQRLTSAEYLSEVSVGENFAHPIRLTGEYLVMSPGFIPKKKLMQSQGSQVGIEDVSAPTLVNELKGNFPNPFNPATTIRFSIAESGPVSLKIYDVRGRLVRTLSDGVLQAGEHDLRWDGRNNSGARAASGVYFVRLQSPTYTNQHKIVMSK